MKIDRWLADGANSPPTIITASDILTSGLTKGGKGATAHERSRRGVRKTAWPEIFCD